jgi:hypothetical protein
VSVILVLVLGAIVNVAVAWALRLWPPTPPPEIKRPPTEAEIRRWVESGPPGERSPPDRCLEVPRTGAPSFLFMERRRSQGADFTVGMRDQNGWPFVALESAKWNLPDAPHRQWNHAWTLPRAWQTQGAEVLPLRPLWPGFAGNTLAYGAVLAVVVFIPAKLRRTLRRRRGRCVKCNYDLRGLPDGPCPECGTF